MRFLLDPCVLYGLRRPPANPGLLQWVAETSEDRLYLSVVTLMEIQKGITRLPPGAKRAAPGTWLVNDPGVRFRQPLLIVDPGTALAWGALLGEGERKGASVPLVDGLRAATAIAHNLTLVTRNLADFDRLPVCPLASWSPS